MRNPADRDRTRTITAAEYVGGDSDVHRALLAELQADVFQLLVTAGKALLRLARSEVNATASCPSDD
jgi:hypothetical protein